MNSIDVGINSELEEMNGENIRNFYTKINKSA